MFRIQVRRGRERFSYCAHLSYFAIDRKRKSARRIPHPAIDLCMLKLDVLRENEPCKNQYGQQCRKHKQHEMQANRKLPLIFRLNALV